MGVYKREGEWQRERERRALPPLCCCCSFFESVSCGKSFHATHCKHTHTPLLEYSYTEAIPFYLEKESTSNSNPASTVLFVRSDFLLASCLLHPRWRTLTSHWPTWASLFSPHYAEVTLSFSQWVQLKLGDLCLWTDLHHLAWEAFKAYQSLLLETTDFNQFCKQGREISLAFITEQDPTSKDTCTRTRS